MNRKIVAVKALIVQDNKFLLAIHKQPKLSASKTWTFLGGWLEPNETSENALRRELREEIQVEIELGQKIGIFEYKSRGYLVIAGTIKGTPIPDRDEILDLKWFTQKEIQQLSQKNLLQTGFEEAVIEIYLKR